MPDHLVRFAAPALVLGLIAACTPKNSPEDPKGSGASGPGGQGTGAAAGVGAGAGGEGATGSGGTGPGMPGWTIVPLLDDKTDPNNVVFRAGNDLVTGIHFASKDEGWVTTSGSNETFSYGGAIFKASQNQITDLLFSGNRDGLCLLGTIDFHGIDKSPDGFVALGYACDVIASHDGGKTFGIEPALAGDQFGIEQIMAMRARATDTLMVSDSGYLSVTKGQPGPNAVWTDIWAPEANPPIPDPVPADQCQGRPNSPTAQTQRTAAYVSPQGDFVAYVAAPNYDPQVCVSTDGGKSFFPKVLPGVADDALPFSPAGVTFASATVGITFWANNIYPGIGYIYRTEDAGKTWKHIDLPSDIANKSIELSSAFFAPDGTHGWIVGFDYDASLALVLDTADGGATWKTSTSDLAAKVSKAGGGKLFTGFALDANHIWVGGEHGILAANEAGGS